MPLDPKKLEEYRRVTDAATPGEWWAERDTDISDETVFDVRTKDGGAWIAERMMQRDAAFVAGAHEAMPLLLAEAKRVREILDLNARGDLTVMGAWELLRTELGG